MTINDKRNKHMCNANGAKELWATQIHETFALQSQYILYFCRVIFFFFKFYPSKKHQTPKSGGWKEGGLGEAEIKHLPRKNNTPKKRKWQENMQLQGRAASDMGRWKCQSAAKMEETVASEEYSAACPGQTLPFLLKLGSWLTWGQLVVATFAGDRTQTPKRASQTWRWRSWSPRNPNKWRP